MKNQETKTGFPKHGKQKAKLFTSPAATSASSTKRKLSNGSSVEHKEKRLKRSNDPVKEAHVESHGGRITGRKPSSLKGSKDASKEITFKSQRSRTVVAHGPNESLSRHLLKKKLTEARKKHSNSNFELGKEVKLLWETLRKRKLENKEHGRIASMILQKMKGKATEMAASHVMSRILQTCLKFCSAEEKASIYEELRPQFLQLAKNTYSHHLVLKLLDHAASDKNQFHKMIHSLHGNVIAFLRHPVASAVVEHAYKLSSSAQKKELLVEFFSPEYALFKNIDPKKSCRLVDLLAKESALKRRNILEHMTSSLQPILEKGIVDHSIVHRALTEYLSIVGKSMAMDVLQQLSGPLLIRMIHTKEGAKLGITCVSLGSRKERKKIMKGLKGHATKVACDGYGCPVLMAILDQVDDTEMLNKFAVNELANNVQQIAFDRHGRRVFLHLLSPQKGQYMSADMLAPLQIVDNLPEQADDEGNDNLGELQTVKKSLKDPFVRRVEILKSSSLGEKLVDLCVAHAGDLLRSSLGKDLIYEVAKGGEDGVLWHVAPSICKLYQAISDIGAQPRTACGTEEHIFEQYHASRILRRLIVESAVVQSDVTAPSFASVLWNTALKGKCLEWAAGHSQKVVSAFQICNDKEVQEKAKKELQPLLDAGVLVSRNDSAETVKKSKQKRASKRHQVSISTSSLS